MIALVIVMSNYVYWAVSIYVVVYTVAVHGFRTQGSPEDIIATNIGIKIEKIGKTVSIVEDLMVSVIIKMPNISKAGSPSDKATTEALKCFMSEFPKSGPSSDQFAKMTKFIEETKYETDKYVSARLELLQPFITPSLSERDSPSRGKRSLVSFLANSVFSLALGGVTEYQIYNINRHISRNKKEIDSVKKALYLLQAEMQSENKQIIGFIKNLSKDMTHYLEKEKCASFYNFWVENSRRKIQECKTIIDNTLWSALSGNNNLLLTPRMINLYMLKAIIDEHGILNKTLFRKNPSTMYSLASISLVEITKELDLAHFVLHIPFITEKNLVDLYQTAQVGIHLEDNSCLYYNLPEHLYKSNGIFYPIKLDKCRKHNNLYACSREDYSNNTACIQGTVNNCKILIKECHNTYEFDMSQVGILLRNNKESDTFTIDRNGWTRAVKLGNQRTAYVSWNNITLVQIGDARIESPNTEFTPIIISDFIFDTNITDFYLDSENVTDLFTSICIKYNSSLGDILPPLVDHWHKQTNEGHFIRYLQYTIVSVIILAIICWIIYLHYLVIQVKSSLIRDRKNRRMPINSYKNLMGRYGSF